MRFDFSLLALTFSAVPVRFFLFQAFALQYGVHPFCTAELLFLLL
jgi:hypothetical protein